MEALFGMLVLVGVLYIGHRSRKANDKLNSLTPAERELKKGTLKHITPYSRFSKRIEAGSVTTIPDWIVVVGLLVLLPIGLMVWGWLNGF